MHRTYTRSLLVLCFLLALSLSGRQAQAVAAPGPPGGYWHTDGTRIVDSAGRTVRIAGVTWYGMETSFWVPAGLDFQPYTTIMDEVRALGYNTMRLPFSNELVERNPVVSTRIGANPQFKGKHALAILDSIVSYAQNIGLKIILDDHLSKAAVQTHVGALDEPLWYTRQYPERAWIRDWQTLAHRYAGNAAVIGCDLRNEPHTVGQRPWTVKAYLTKGATWGPFNGKVNAATDWRGAAQRAGNAILAVNPHLLVFVEGIQIYPNPRNVRSILWDWWSGLLSPVKQYPVILKVPHHLVYSVHEWGPRKSRLPWFKGMTYRSLSTLWHDRWAFLLDPGSPYRAPVWLGEFGTCTTATWCFDARSGSPQSKWFQFTLRYLREHPRVGWSFFAVNGSNANNCIADNGVLNGWWDRPANGTLQRNIRSIQPPGQQTTGTQPTLHFLPRHQGAHRATCPWMGRS